MSGYIAFDLICLAVGAIVCLRSPVVRAMVLEAILHPTQDSLIEVDGRKVTVTRQRRRRRQPGRDLAPDHRRSRPPRERSRG